MVTNHPWLDWINTQQSPGEMNIAVRYVVQWMAQAMPQTALIEEE